MNSSTAPRDSHLSVAAITLFGLVGPYTFLISPVIAGQMAVQMDWSPGTIGLLMAGELAGASLISIPAVRMLRALTPRRLVALATLVFILANLLSAATTTIAWFLAARVVAGAAGGVLSVVCLLAAARSENPPRSFAFWTGGQTVTAAAGLLYLPDLFPKTGLGGLYGALALAALLALPFLYGFQADKMLPPQADGQPTRPAARLNMLAIFCFYVAIGGGWAFLGIPGSDIGFSEAEIGILTSGAMGVSVIGSFLASYTGGSAWQGRWSIGSYVGLIGCLAALALTKDHLSFSASTILLQILWAFLLPMLLAALADSDEHGAMVILSNMIIGGGAALGPLLAGYTIDWSGYGAVVVEGVALFLVSASAYGWARWRSTAGTVQASSHSLSHG